MEATKHGEPQSTLLRSLPPIFSPKFARQVVAEIIGTYLLVFVSGGAAALSATDEKRLSKLGASVAGGLIVTVMIYSVGHISGAHFNPALTLGFASVGHFPWQLVPFYASAQFTGAISASFTLRALLEPVKHMATTSPTGSTVQALVMEIMVTFILMFVTSAVATDNKAIGELAGIAVGSAVCISSILAGPVSGGSMNPGRSIGPAVASGYYRGIWVYIVGPFTGAVLGAWSYNLIRDDADEGISSQQRLSFKHHRVEKSSSCEDMTSASNDPDHVNITCPC